MVTISEAVITPFSMRTSLADVMARSSTNVGASTCMSCSLTGSRPPYLKRNSALRWSPCTASAANCMMMRVLMSTLAFLYALSGLCPST